MSFFACWNKMPNFSNICKNVFQQKEMSRNSGKNKIHPFKAFALTFSSAELHTCRNRQINRNNLFLRPSTDLIVLLKYTIFCTIKDNDWKSLKIIESFKLCWVFCTQITRFKELHKQKTWQISLLLYFCQSPALTYFQHTHTLTDGHMDKVHILSTLR